MAGLQRKTLLPVGSLCFPVIRAASVVTPGRCSRAKAGKGQGSGRQWWFSPDVPCQAPWAASSLSRELFSPQLTRHDSSSWSQAIVINAVSFPFLSGFQTCAQAPASSHQPLPWCQWSSSKQEEGSRGLPGDRGKKGESPWGRGSGRDALGGPQEAGPQASCFRCPSSQGEQHAPPLVLEDVVLWDWVSAKQLLRGLLLCFLLL